MTDKTFFSLLMVLIIAGYVFLNIYIGALSLVREETCNQEFNRRIEYVFWGNAVVCWLYEDIGEKKKHKL